MAAEAGRSMPGRRTGAVELSMRPLTGARLLAAWERGAGQNDLDRTLTLLAAALPDAAPAEIAQLDLRRRNRDLLRLRRMTFGDVLAGVVACASCAAPLEFTISIPPVLEHLERLDTVDAVEWTAGSARCVLRAVTTEDLQLAMLEPSGDAARRRLLDRCLAAVGIGDAALDALRSDPEVLGRFARLHEAAEINCEVRCPACGALDVVDLDIARLLWSEVRHAALRLLRDVHDLAGAYGWPETEILAMSTARRRAYLDMVRA